MSNTDLEIGTNKWITTYSLIASSIGLLISILTFVFVDGDEFLNNLLAMNLTFTEILLSILIAGLIYLISRYFEFKKNESNLKRDDFINTLQQIHEAQISLCKDAIGKHIYDLKHNFLDEIKKVLKEDEVDKSELAKKLNYGFREYVQSLKENEAEIDVLLGRLERHKYKGILDEIKADKIKESINK